MASRRIKDHRGRPCVVAWRWRDALAALGPGQTIRFALLAGLMGIAVWLAITAQLASPPGMNRPHWYQWPLLIFMILMGVGEWVYLLIRTGPAVAAARLAEGRCPTCEYGLDGLPPEPDGCRVCPECGAAWRPPSPPAKYHD